MTTINGETDVAKFTGYTARLFQHEYDHMEGTDFKTRATRYHMEKGLKNMKLMNRKRKRNAA
jgi:peptide deformylase